MSDGSERDVQLERCATALGRLADALEMLVGAYAKVHDLDPFEVTIMGIQIRDERKVGP